MLNKSDSIFISKAVTNQPIVDAINKAAHYLLTQQHSHGYWQDYHLPVGSSDAWVTGYVGYVLTEIRHWLPVEPYCQALTKAAKWLKHQRHYNVGWGYNGVTGADADSTAWVLRFLGKLNEHIDNKNLCFLMQHYKPNQGFATYLTLDAWGNPHPDVTANVCLCLIQYNQALNHSALMNCLNFFRFADGTWPAYWWRTCHYSTWLHQEWMSILKWQNDFYLPIINQEKSYAINNAFDLACITGIAALQNHSINEVQSLVTLLLAEQQANGAWQGGANLRVTAPTCLYPWLDPIGSYYIDHLGLITTASAVHALGQVLCNKT